MIIMEHSGRNENIFLGVFFYPITKKCQRINKIERLYA